jgi:Co/Zn/Cd efflux system component
MDEIRLLKGMEASKRVVETKMKQRKMMIVAIVGLIAVLSGYTAYTQGHKDDPALVKALAGVKITLQQGLTAVEAEGQPISATFEMEDGKLQLSVYTAKGGKFSEVIVDHTTGKITKSEAITEGDDLTASKSQSAAMAKAKTSLKAATDKAVNASAGSRAVSVIPALKNGRAVASVVLLKGEEMKPLEESLE